MNPARKGALVGGLCTASYTLARAGLLPADAARAVLDFPRIGLMQIAAVGTAASEIRKAISFARAEDPELAALQTATVTTVAAAVDSVGIKLSRAVGL